MSAAISLNVSGLAEIKRAMDKLGDSAARGLMRKAMVAGSKPLLKAARQLVPVNSQELKKSLGAKTKTYRDGTIVVIVGPRTGRKKTINGRPNDPVNYAHLVEFGTKAHLIGKKSIFFFITGRWTKGPIEHPGSTGVRFMTRAFDATGTQVIAAARKKGLADIEKLARKVASKKR